MSNRYKDDKKLGVIWMFLFSVGAIIVIACTLRFLKEKPLAKPQAVHLEERLVTINFNTSVLETALEKHAADWCEVSRTIPLVGNLQIKNCAQGMSKFNSILLNDSLAPKMAREYPHLFRYDEKDGVKTFEFRGTYAAERYVVVPAWLVRKLIENDVLELK